MKTKNCFLHYAAALVVSAAGLSVAADSHVTENVPGFRPESELAGKFLSDLSSSRIAVLPTVVRTMTTTMTFDAPQKEIVEFMQEHKLGIPEARQVTLDVGELKGRGQFEWFQNDEAKLGEIVKKQSGADYYLIPECLVPQTPSGEIVMFGIDVYVLDAEGRNAFSFLLNSHHQMLVDANLMSADSSEEGYEALVMKATDVALDALAQQIEQARKAEAH